MRLTTAILAWTGCIALVVLACVAWIAIRYDTDPTCASLGSTCAFDDSGLLRFAMIGIPVAWVAGLVVLLVWRFTTKAGPKSK